MQCCTACNKSGDAIAYDLIARSLVDQHCFDRYGPSFCSRYVNGTDVFEPQTTWTCDGENPQIAFRSCRKSCGFCNFTIVHYTLDNAMKSYIIFHCLIVIFTCILCKQQKDPPPEGKVVKKPTAESVLQAVPAKPAPTPTPAGGAGAAYGVLVVPGMAKPTPPKVDKVAAAAAEVACKKGSKGVTKATPEEKKEKTGDGDGEYEEMNPNQQTKTKRSAENTKSKIPEKEAKSEQKEEKKSEKSDRKMGGEMLKEAKTQTKDETSQKERSSKKKKLIDSKKEKSKKEAVKSSKKEIKSERNVESAKKSAKEIPVPRPAMKEKANEIKSGKKTDSQRKTSKENPAATKPFTKEKAENVKPVVEEKKDAKSAKKVESQKKVTKENAAPRPASKEKADPAKATPTKVKKAARSDKEPQKETPTKVNSKKSEKSKSKKSCAEKPKSKKSNKSISKSEKTKSEKVGGADALGDKLKFLTKIEVSSADLTWQKEKGTNMLKITNKSGKAVVFKIKSSNNQLYTVLPVHAKIEDGAYIHITVTKKPGDIKQDKLNVIVTEALANTPVEEHFKQKDMDKISRKIPVKMIEKK